MPTRGWLLNVDNLAYREALGGDESFDAYRVDLRAFLKHGGHVLAVRAVQLVDQRYPVRRAGDGDTSRLQAGSVPLPVHVLSRSRIAWRSTSDGAPRNLPARRALYGDALVPLDRSTYPTIGAGLHFVIKPAERMLVDLEYAQASETAGASI